MPPQSNRIIMTYLESGKYSHFTFVFRDGKGIVLSLFSIWKQKSSAYGIMNIVQINGINIKK